MRKPHQIPGSEPILQSIYQGRIFLAQNIPRPKGNYRCLLMEPFLQYEPIYNDFGPENISSICRFVTALHKTIDAEKEAKMMCLVDKGRNKLTNSILLLGAYMVLKLKLTAEVVWESFFSNPSELHVESYHDASAEDSENIIGIIHCWQALQRATLFRWFQYPTLQDGLWGRLNLSEHEHYESALNGNFSQV